MKGAKLKIIKLLKIAGFAACFIFFLITLANAVAEVKQKPVKSLSINIDHNTGIFFVNEDELRTAMEVRAGLPLEQLSMDQLNMFNLETTIEKNPHIKTVDVYSSINGDIRVSVKQKQPLLRIINNNYVSYYIDNEGGKMPLSSNFTARVPIATGAIDLNQDEKTDSLLLQKLYHLAEFIHKSDFWKAQVEQVYVTAAGEFELVPRLGEHIILIGDGEEIEEKFEKLMIFYKEGLKSEGWDKYRMIDLRFKDQIVCKK